MTAADGAFRLAHLAPGRTQLWVSAPDFTTLRVEADVAARGAPLVVRLAREARLRVKVVDADGATVVGADVEVGAAGSGPETSARTDHRGVVEMRVGAGRLRVTVVGREGGADVELAEGGEAAVRVVVK